jgi:hypothetical protein
MVQVVPRRKRPSSGFKKLSFNTAMAIFDCSEKQSPITICNKNLRILTIKLAVHKIKTSFYQVN